MASYSAGGLSIRFRGSTGKNIANINIIHIGI
jgi:hypothetical protein